MQMLIKPEQVDTLNNADAMIFQTEKQLNGGDKLSDEKKANSGCFRPLKLMIKGC